MNVPKRPIIINGRRSSVSLETEFWRTLTVLASRANKSRNALIADIDAARPKGRNLSSAIRVHVLQQVQAGAE